MDVPPRQASLSRETTETRIRLSLNIDGTGRAEIDTGIPFFDHMLTLLARHGLLDLTLKAEGDLAVDYHHTVEDVGIVLGEALREAIGEKRGMTRYGCFLLPMDETLAQVAIDLGGRPFLVYRAELRESYVRDFNVHLFREFFQALANSAGANVHLVLVHGDEPHHVAEAFFKGLGRSLAMATRLDPRRGEDLPTTKGKL